jgi:hypothetical protein
MKERSLLYFSVLVLLVIVFSFLSDAFILLVHGLSQAVFEGNSNGKTFGMLFWFFFMPLISFVFIKLNLIEKMKCYSKKFLFVFFSFAFFGFSLGLIEFALIGLEFNSLGPFATITEEGTVMNWQASKLSHNHFPKASIYFLESMLGLDFKGSFDDGFPWYSFIPNVQWWSIAFLLVELTILISGVLFINSKLNENSFFDYLVFLAGFLALLISVLDGGIASGAAMMSLFFFALYFSRNYLKIENHAVATLLPLMVIGFIAFADVVVPIEIGNNFYASSMILFFGLAYYFFNEIKLKKLRFNSLNLLLALVFAVAFLMSVGQYLDFSFGREITPGYLIYSFQQKEKGGGLFVYGLPSELTKEEVDFEVRKFGKIIESDKAGWSYYALIKPERNFRTGELEALMKKKFSAGSYLYVEQVIPTKRIHSYRIVWFNETNSDDFLRSKFLASKTVSKKDHGKETEIVLESKLPFLWEMTSILSEIRSNGFKGKILLIKTS